LLSIDQLSEIVSIDRLPEIKWAPFAPKFAEDQRLDQLKDIINERDDVDIYPRSTVSELPEAPGAGGEDTLASQLHPDAYSCYKAANMLYQQDGNRRFPYIEIKSGRRGIAEQIALYRRYVEHLQCDGPVAPAANQPKESFITSEWRLISYAETMRSDLTLR
jgi:hypothetical protein